MAPGIPAGPASPVPLAVTGGLIQVPGQTGRAEPKLPQPGLPGQDIAAATASECPVAVERGRAMAPNSAERLPERGNAERAPVAGLAQFHNLWL
jgi:hypothetical protein